MTIAHGAERPQGVSPSSMLRIGGVAALLLAAGYIATIPLFAAVGPPPTGAQPRLDFHAGTEAIWWAIVALSVFTDLLFLPVSIALYAALRRSSAVVMLLATAFTLLFVVLDLAVTWPGYVSLIDLSEQYATAVTADQRAILVAAAAYPDAVLSSVLISIYSVLTLGTGILLTGLVILRSTFGRASGIVGVVTGLVGVASVAHVVLSGEFSPLLVAVSLLTILWLVLIGRGLLRSQWSLPEAGPCAPSEARSIHAR